jgi:predicted transcriptional regulator of viral defense system
MLIICYNISMKVSEYTQTLTNMLSSNDGVITTSAALQAGVPKSTFYRFVDSNGLEKQSHGVYVSKDAFPDEFALLQMRFPKAIFSHDAALYLHDMSEREPIPLSVTVPSNYNASAVKDQGLRVFYVKPQWYDLGICKVTTPEGNKVLAYDKERTICDMVRRRSSVDVAEFSYALKMYATSKTKNLPRLSDYARTMNIESRIWDVLGILL